MYTAIVLNSASSNTLQHLVLPIQINIEGWDVLCHHMTLTMGTPEEYNEFMGGRMIVVVDAIGFNDKVVAGRVGLFENIWEKPTPKCTNPTPHITMFVNRANGGKPKHSNDITEWIKLPDGLLLLGEVEQCK